MTSWQRILDRAYAAAESLKHSRPESYELLFRRIKGENLTLDYVNLSLYSQYYVSSEYLAKIEDFEYYSTLYGYINYTESRPMSEKIAEWRNNIL
jgi:hypothetical protein